MTKNLLKKFMYRNYNLPNVTAFIHATLLVFFMTGLIIFAYNIMAPEQIQITEADSVGILSFHSYFWYNKLPLLMAFGLLAGLNGLVYYLLFRLRKKAVAYSMSAVVLAVQVAIIGSSLAMI